jgi:HEAT repeat protein
MAEIIKVEELIRTLQKSPDPTERVRAAQALGHLGDPKAIDALIVALADSYREVRVAATES